MHKPRLILVVDDTPADALLLSKSLAQSGYAILTARNGRDAIRTAVETLPDLIFLDMTMPEMDGIATCCELKGNTATGQIPIIFVTAHADSERIVKAFAAGGSDYVTKPIRTNEILARLSVQLRLREAEESLVLRNKELESLTKQLAETNETLARQSRIDELTNVLNRRGWDEAAQIEHERALRYGRPYSILMLDVDSFKSFNDSLGHAKGDRCLRQIAEVTAGSCRTTDLVGRYGGEEFVVLATETSAEAGVRLAERIRQSVWSLSIRHPGSPAGRVTISLGVAGGPEGSLRELLRSADECLYRAKNGGRNLVYGRHAAMLAPVRPGDSAAGPVFERRSITQRQCAPKILVVEDDRANRMVYRGCLEKEGYGIIEVENGEAAIKAVVEHRPDLILMDVMMPVMDGIECTRRLKADPEWRDLPIIIVSARDDTDSALAGLEAGAEDYLTNPVRTMELVARVRSMILLTTERRDLLRSYELRAEQIRFLTVLVDFCREIGNASTPDEVFGCLVATVGEITCSRRVWFMSPDSGRKYLTVARSLGMDEQLARTVKVPVGEGVAGQVFATREAILVNAPRQDDSDGASSAPEPYLSVPFLATPIKNSRHIFGVLNVTDRVEKRPFESRELEYVELVAGIAASVLHTIRNRQARDDARDLVVSALAGLAEHRDSDTGRHVERVTQYSCILAETLRHTDRFSGTINDGFIRHLTQAVPLHDIGKVAIPDRILLKPGKLTLDEMAVMRMHVEIGADTLRPLIAKIPDADSLKMALDVIRAHHEWFDGSGYPQGLKAEAIPLSARIVAVADVYDALTTSRVYKAAISIDDAEQIILQSSGKQFDPVIVEAFVKSRGEFQAVAHRLADGKVDEQPPARPELADVAHAIA